MDSGLDIRKHIVEHEILKMATETWVNNLTGGDAIGAGTIAMFGGGNAPGGWLNCDGAAVSRTTYVVLFNAIGTSYGVGDGSTTFNLPNFASKFVRGNTPGTGSGSDTHTHTGPSHTHTGTSHTHGGATGAHTLTIVEMPNHKHHIWFTINDGLNHDRVCIASVGSNESPHNYSYTDTQGCDGAHSHTISADGAGTTGASGTGNTSSDSNVPAYTGTNFIIKYTAASNLGDSEESNTIWEISGSNVYTKDPTKNVGVGTSSASERLDVVGNVEINGNIIVTGTVDGVDIAARDAELETLTDNSMADTLHRHSELVASDGSPDPAVSVDENGIVSMPYQSGCRVRLTSPQSIPTTTWTKMQFGTKDWDIQGEFDNVTNHRFTATVSGYYQINLITQITGVANTHSIYAGIYKNGILVVLTRDIASAATIVDLIQEVSDIIHLDVGDYIEGYIYQISGANRIANNAPYNNCMSIMKIA